MTVQNPMRAVPGVPGVCLYQELGSGAAVPYWRKYTPETKKSTVLKAVQVKKPVQDWKKPVLTV